MPSDPANKRYTCRYWALGPSCPNVDAFGTNVCEFAHWDTGRMASHFQQRGTCMPWKVLGYCGRGAGCWYEHRITGVTGLYQGTIELSGCELQIADAASKAGFNTFRHEALFDLIWAVKKIALQAGAGQFNPFPMPRSPFYPDRYRPNGVGDNTNTKRKRKAMARRQALASLTEQRSRPVQQLVKKRDMKSRMEDNLIDLSHSDNEDMMDMGNALGTGLKRQKVSGNQTVQHPVASTSTSTEPSNRELGSFTVVDVPRDNKSVALATGRRSNAKAFRDPPTQAAHTVSTFTVEAGITKQLLLVKTQLENAKKTMNTCQATMKALFDVHHGTFDDDEAMAALRKLSDCMNKAFDSGKEGAEEVSKIVSWLGQNKDDIL